MTGCDCGSVHKDAHSPDCRGYSTECRRLREQNLRLFDALSLAERALSATREHNAWDLGPSSLLRAIRGVLAK